jgi:hypothetical protein
MTFRGFGVGKKEDNGAFKDVQLVNGSVTLSVSPVEAGDWGVLNNEVMVLYVCWSQLLCS